MMDELTVSIVHESLFLVHGRVVLLHSRVEFFLFLV